MSNLEERVKKEIEKTGFTTEIKVSTILKHNGWQVYNEYPYLDTEENRIRLLDVKATKSKTSRKPEEILKTQPSCELYIECKKSIKHSWVFYTEIMPYPYWKITIDKLVGNLLKSMTMIQSDKQNAPDIFSKIPMKLEKLNYRIALSHKTVFARKDDFYNAQMQILKTLHYEASLRKTLENISIIPLVIFDGNLFECKYTELKEFHIAKTNYTRYLSFGLPTQKMPALIDVVALDYLPEYVKLIEGEFNL
jgi:hypothetical protein